VVVVPPFQAWYPRKNELSHQKVLVTLRFMYPWSGVGVAGVPSNTVVPLTLMLISPLAWSVSLMNVSLSWSNSLIENVVVSLLFMGALLVGFIAVVLMSFFSTVYVNPDRVVSPSAFVALNVNSQSPTLDASEPL